MFFKQTFRFISKMPSCAIATCNHRSESVNLANDGITFHRFPCNPEIKDKWITATCKGPLWWPSTKSTICSVHFKENEFQPLPKSRRLFSWAVPTKKLPIVLTSVSPNLSSISDDVEATKKSSIIAQPISATTTNLDTKVPNVISPETDNLSSLSEPSSSTHEDKNIKYVKTPRKLNLGLQLESYKSQIQQKNKKIRTLQKKNSRYRKKITDLKNILKEFLEKSVSQ